MDDRTGYSSDRPCGAVTFLDVLGWKGIWGREADAIGSLQSLINGIERKARELERGRGKNILTTRVISISDTVVLVTPATRDDAATALVLHGELCASALPDSIMKGIPIRGACAFGSYEISGNGSIFLGAAIDEAASWHEHADWIGVHMAPSARFCFGNEDKEPWCKYRPPYKNSTNFETYVVKWSLDLANPDDLGVQFSRMGPLLPELIHKYTNTLKFIQDKCLGTY